jgi:serine phosphatase RsbU (regulator of sigma subunit)
VVEAMDEHANEYGQRRFFDLVAANRELPPQEIIARTLEDIQGFTHGFPQHDDITVIAIRVMEKQMQPQEQFRASTAGA